jgi:hypothetical protein
VVSGSVVRQSGADDPGVRAATQKALDLHGTVQAGPQGSVCPDCTVGAGSKYRTSIYQKAGVTIGIWVRPIPETCNTLKIFFPGQAQALGFYSNAVPPSRRSEWVALLLEGKAFQLAPTLVDAGCPVLMLGEPKAALNAEDLQSLLDESGANQVELLAHSGGYTGLTTLARNLKGSPLVSKVSAVKLLDNFYTPGVLPAALKSTFGEDHLRKICTGFYTDHNAARYRSGFKSICPNVVRKSDHVAPVGEFFR